MLIRWSFLALVAALFAAAAAPASAGDVRVTVTFRGEPDPALLARFGARVVAAVDGTTTVAARLPAQLAGKLRQLPEVERVEEDGVALALGRVEAAAVKTQSTSTSESVPWGVNRVWGGGVAPNQAKKIKVAILDTGIDLDHPDLQANIRGNKDFTGTKGSGDDDHGHGTHVAGTVGAIGGNSMGVVGVAPKAYLYAWKVLDKNGSGYMSDVTAGIRWCAGRVKIANMSFGSSTPSSLLEDACAYAAGKGVLLIAAAGNAGDDDATTNEYGYPAAYSTVVAVGATRSNDLVSKFSNTGPYLEVSAPGSSITSTKMGGGYGGMSGTSMASPHVAGMAALLWKTTSSPTAATIRAELGKRVRDLGPTGWDAGYGYGIVYFPK